MSRGNNLTSNLQDGSASIHHHETGANLMMADELPSIRHKRSKRYITKSKKIGKAKEEKKLHLKFSSGSDISDELPGIKSHCSHQGKSIQMPDVPNLRLDTSLYDFSDDLPVFSEKYKSRSQKFGSKMQNISDSSPTSVGNELSSFRPKLRGTTKYRYRNIDNGTRRFLDPKLFSSSDENTGDAPVDSEHEDFICALPAKKLKNKIASEVRKVKKSKKLLSITNALKTKLSDSSVKNSKGKQEKINAQATIDTWLRKSQTNYKSRDSITESAQECIGAKNKHPSVFSMDDDLPCIRLRIKKCKMKKLPLCTGSPISDIDSKASNTHDSSDIVPNFKDHKPFTKSTSPAFDRNVSNTLVTGTNNVNQQLGSSSRTRENLSASSCSNMDLLPVEFNGCNSLITYSKKENISSNSTCSTRLHEIRSNETLSNSLQEIRIPNLKGKFDTESTSPSLKRTMSLSKAIVTGTMNMNCQPDCPKSTKEIVSASTNSCSSGEAFSEELNGSDSLFDDLVEDENISTNATCSTRLNGSRSNETLASLTSTTYTKSSLKEIDLPDFTYHGRRKFLKKTTSKPKKRQTSPAIDERPSNSERCRTSPSIVERTSNSQKQQISPSIDKNTLKCAKIEPGYGATEDSVTDSQTRRRVSAAYLGRVLSTVTSTDDLEVIEIIDQDHNEPSLPDLTVGILDISKIQCVKDLSKEQLVYLVRKNQDYLRSIAKGERYCRRHNLYLMGGRARDKLTENVFLNRARFDEDQDDIILNAVVDIFSERNSMKYMDYIFKVLFPEVLMKIFMDIRKCDYEEATRQMLNV